MRRTTKPNRKVGFSVAFGKVAYYGAFSLSIAFRGIKQPLKYSILRLFNLVSLFNSNDTRKAVERKICGFVREKRQKKRRKLILVQFASKLAGVAGFEPTNDGVRAALKYLKRVKIR